ncbi:MAG: hypothetical protein ACR2J8_14325, partial [Thermomicrobiales bacterium]
LESSMIETIGLRFDGHNDQSRTVAINLFHPHLIAHDLPFFEITADPDAGRYDIDLDVPASAERPADRIEILLREEANERIHCWNLPPELTVTPAAPTGAALAMSAIRATENAPARRGPAFGRLTNPPTIRRRSRIGRRRDAVLLACWVPEGSLEIAAHTLASVQRHHADSKIFAGINRGTSPKWLRMLRQSGLDVEIAHVPPGIVTDSDAAGFVAALDLLRASGESFDLVWFGHTKGVSHPELTSYLHIRWAIEKRFWSLRAEIERLFTDPEIGLYAPQYIINWKVFRFDNDALERMVPGERRAFDLCAPSTFYVMRYETVRDFVAQAPERLFQEGVDAFGGSRYFFEWGFPNLPLMYGLKPAIPRGIGKTTLPATADLNLMVWADERQNHALVRREYERYRGDPVGYLTRIEQSPIEAHQIPRPECPSRAIWVEDDQGARWTITAS